MMATPIEAFFRTFERRSAESDAAALAGMFAPSFLIAGPAGSQVIRAGDLEQAIPKRKHMFATLGCTSTSLETVDETALDDRYSLVRTEWQWRFERSGDAPIAFTLPATYLIERSDDRYQIVVYIAHTDAVTELRRRGWHGAA